MEQSVIGRSAAALAVLIMVLAGCSAVATDRSPVDPIAPPSMEGSGPTSSTQSAAPLELGPTRSDEHVAFSVSLNLPGAAEMDAYVAGLTTPGSASFHKYLTAHEFGAKFGLSDAEVGRVVAWLSDAGLAATAAPQRTSITVEGTAGQANSLLGITLADRQSPSGVRYHVPVGEPQIPQAIRDSVEIVVGLDTEPVQHPALGTIGMSGVPEPGITPSVVAT